MCLRRISLPQKPWLIDNYRPIEKLSPFTMPLVPAFWSSPKMPLNLCEDSIAEKKVYAGVHFQKTRKASCHVALRVF